MDHEYALAIGFGNEELFVVETLQHAGSESTQLVGGGACNSNCNCNSSNCNEEN